MKRLSVVVVLVLGLACTLAEESKSSEITKLEVVDLGEVNDQSDSKVSESQRKRDSGYVYNRPDRLSARHRFNGPGNRPNSNGYRAKILSRYPSQSQRPFNSYGVPLQSGPVVRPSSQYGGPQNSNFGSNQNQFHSHQGQFNRHRNQQNQVSNQSNKPNSGYFNQEIPGPVRYVDFVKPNPIASQNDVPFGPNTANYLPPRNQELPIYSAPNTFGSGQQNFQQQNSQIQTQNGDSQFQSQNSDFESQSFGQNSNQGISDAAHFLAQNAQAISQLYGAPATDQGFAPTNEEFSGQNNQIQGVFGQNTQLQDQQFQSSGQGSQSSQGFLGSLPSYASGTLSSEESLEQIQSKEKDRLILQLQTLLSQSRSQNAANAELSGQYAQNHGNYIQNQNLLASISSQFQNKPKYNDQNNQNVNQLGSGSFGSANTAFGQAPFIPGTSPRPIYTIGYDLTTQQAPTTTTTTTTTTASPIQPSRNPNEDGSSQTGTSVPAPTPNFPQYNGFVPSLIGGTNFVGNLPSYDTLGSGFVPASIQPGETSPTHVGLPIPQDPNASQQPQAPGSSVHYPNQPSATPAALPSSPNPVGRPVAIPTQPLQPIQPIHPIHQIHPVRPVHPVHPVHSVYPIAPLAPAVTQVHPISTPVHSIQQFHPIVSPLQPVPPPVHPVLPAVPAVSPIHSAPASAHPAYGVQSAVYNPLLYKPVKTVYPVYYYTNLPYQLQKPAHPTYPWSYAPSYAQAKPAQIWK